MSYTNQTTHYGIPLPTETDLVNGLDWNTSSEAIDSAIYEASEAAGTASRDITAIKATIANLQDADVHFQQDLTEATGRIATLEQNAGKDEQDIQDLADMITDKEVTQAQSDAHVSVGEWFRYNGVLYVCTVEINIGDTIIPNTNCRATNIEDEMPQGGSVDADDVGYDNTDVPLSATNVQDAVDEVAGQLFASNQTAGVSEVPFRFGCDNDGNFGYILTEGGADTVIPFNAGGGSVKILQVYATRNQIIGEVGYNLSDIIQFETDDTANAQTYAQPSNPTINTTIFGDVGFRASGYGPNCLANFTFTSDVIKCEGGTFTTVTAGTEVSVNNTSKAFFIYV